MQNVHSFKQLKAPWWYLGCTSLINSFLCKCKLYLVKNTFHFFPLVCMLPIHKEMASYQSRFSLVINRDWCENLVSHHIMAAGCTKHTVNHSDREAVINSQFSYILIIIIATINSLQFERKVQHHFVLKTLFLRKQCPLN